MCLGCVIECCSASANMWANTESVLGVSLSSQSCESGCQDYKLKFVTMFETVCTTILGTSLVSITITSNEWDLRWVAYIIGVVVFGM
jgi:hypothetical protein